MSGTRAPLPGPAWTPATPAPAWDGYLDRIEGCAHDAEGALAAGDAFSWPDLALPQATPTPAQLERARRLHARMATLLEAGQARHDAIGRELSALVAARPRQPAAGLLGTSLDVTG